jgi:pyruvate/2-oxoglutarate/acetoin dehydrogenase E1 component
MGGRRGYGPTHSQTLDKLFLGVPGLHVVAPTVLGNPGELLKQAILKDNQPVLFIENKLQYLQKCFDTSLSLDFDLVSSTLPNAYTSIYTLSVKDAPPPSLTLTTYGYMSNLAKQAVLHLAYEYEIFCDLIVPTQLVPFKTQDSLPIQLIESLKRTNRLLTVEENSFTLGWGAEIIARAAQIFGPTLKAVQRLAAVETPIPASPPLEDLTFPNVDDIVQTARMMV